MLARLLERLALLPARRRPRKLGMAKEKPQWARDESKDGGKEMGALTRNSRLVWLLNAGSVRQR